MPELDEKRVSEIVKDEINTHRIPERLAVIEEQNKEIRHILDQKADKTDLRRLEDKFDTFKEDVKENMKDIKKYIIGFSIAVIVAVIGAALAK